MSATKPEKSVLIVGAGVFGASTAFHLSKSYSDPSLITVIDRSAPSPELAASTDINKIVRADYTNSLYCDLGYEALEAWNSWPELTPFFHRSGWVAFDLENDGTYDEIRKIFRARGHDPTEDVSFEEIEKRWGGLLRGSSSENFHGAYVNPEAGWCDAAAATKKIMDEAIKAGVRYRIGDVARLVLGSNDNVHAVELTDGRQVSADIIVLATGAWTSSILTTVEDDLQISEADRVERQVTAAGVSVAHFEMTDAEMKCLEGMPVIVYGAHGEVLPPPKENCLLKFNDAHTFTNTITTASGHKISVPPAGRHQHDVPESLKKEMKEVIISKVMPGFTQDRPAKFHRLCWDGYTPTQDWLLSRHPDPRLSNLYFATGGSFHGYKFLPVIGKYVSNVLSGKGNGPEKDEAWAWKKNTDVEDGAHKYTRPRRELADLE